MNSRTRMYGVLILALGLSVACSSPKSVPMGNGTAAGLSGSGTGAAAPVGGTGATIAAPTTLTATGVNVSQIDLTWANPAGAGAVGFKLYRSGSSAGPFTQTGGTLTGLSYSDVGLSTNTTYYYEITAVDVNGLETAPSAVASGTTLLNGAPSDLKAVPASSVSIQLTWTDNSSTETGFLIERSLTNGSGAVWTTLATVPANTTRYTDTLSLHPSNSYYYRVTAVGLTPVAISNVALGTTYSGAWDELFGSGSGTGISATPSSVASFPSVTTDSTGRIFSVWEQNVNGTNQIYLAIFDPNNPDRGWKPIAVNTTLSSESFDATGTIVTSVTFSPAQTSVSGNGISMAAGDAQRPRVAYDSTRNEIVVIWQEMRNGHYEIMGRRFHPPTFYNTFYSFYVTAFSDSVITKNNAAATNELEDDAITTSPSTWNLSNTTTESLRAELVSVAGVVYVVWEEYITGTRTWQVYGSTSTLGATAVYPAIPATPVVAAIDSVGATSNTGSGISAAAATKHAHSPSIGVADATHIYVAWQSTGVASTDISTNFCDGSNFTGATVPLATAGSSQNPRIAVDPNAAAPVPYVVWEDNTLNNRFNIYLLQGNTLGTVWSNLTASGITSGDITTTGVSGATSGSAQTPSIAVYDTAVYVAWQDTSSGLGSNIFVKRYLAQDAIPGESAVWDGLDNSDSGTGISAAASGGAFQPEIRVNTAGALFVTWEDLLTSGSSNLYRTYLRRW